MVLMAFKNDSGVSGDIIVFHNGDRMHRKQ
jgi:hypothetical protein